MKYLLLITALFIHSITYGQRIAEEGKATIISDTTLFRYYKEDLKRHGLKLLSESSYKEYYRIWVDNQIIELWKDSVYHGTITSYAYEYNRYPKEHPTNRKHSIQKAITSNTVKKIISEIISAKISTLPLEYDSTAKWACADCSSYNIEGLNNNSLYFKSYEQPDLYRERYETARIVDDLFRSILQKADAEQQQDILRSNVPFEAYTFGGNVLVTKVLSKKERKQYRKERDNYRKSVGIPNKPRK